MQFEGGKKLPYLLGNMHLEDQHHTGPRKIQSFYILRARFGID